jgi:hypothetical protein
MLAAHVNVKGLAKRRKRQGQENRFAIADRSPLQGTATSLARTGKRLSPGQHVEDLLGRVSTTR